MISTRCKYATKSNNKKQFIEFHQYFALQYAKSDKNIILDSKYLFSGLPNVTFQLKKYRSIIPQMQMRKKRIFFFSKDHTTNQLNERREEKKHKHVNFRNILQMFLNGLAPNQLNEQKKTANKAATTTKIVKRRVKCL